MTLYAISYIALYSIILNSSIFHKWYSLFIIYLCLHILIQFADPVTTMIMNPTLITMVIMEIMNCEYQKYLLWVFDAYLCIWYISYDEFKYMLSDFWNSLFECPKKNWAFIFFEYVKHILIIKSLYVYMWVYFIDHELSVWIVWVSETHDRFIINYCINCSDYFHIYCFTATARKTQLSVSM